MQLNSLNNNIRNIYVPKTQINNNTQTSLLPPDSNSSNVSFQGLNSVLKHRVLEEDSLRKKLIKHYPNSAGVIGNIPFDWIKNIPAKQKAKDIKNIYKIFDKAVSFLRKEDIDSPPNKPTYKNGLKKANKMLFKALKQAGLKTDEQVAEYLDYGAFGIAFKFKVDAEDYVLKVYKALDTKNDSMALFGHGNFHENARAFFLKRNTSNKNDHAEYFFGSIKSGYMVEKYVNETDTVKRKYPLSLLGLHKCDSLGNRNDNCVIFDYGGIYVTNKQLASSKKARYIQKQRNLLSGKEMILKYNELNNNEKIDLLAEIPNIFDKQSRLSLLKKLFCEKNQSIRTDTVAVLSGMPHPQQLEAIKFIAKDADLKTQMKLAAVLHRLKPENQIIILGMLTKNVSFEIINYLSKQIRKLAPEIRPEALQVIQAQKTTCQSQSLSLPLHG